MDKQKMMDIMGTIMGKAPTEEEKKKNPMNIKGATDTIEKRNQRRKAMMDEIDKG